MTDELEGSLRRQGTDYVDLFLLHHTEKGGTPPAVVAAAMDELVRSGKTRYWGVSNHSGNEVQEYVDAAAAVGTAPPVGTEDYYNIAGNQLMDSGKSRTAWLERDLFPVTRKAGLGLIAFSPVDCGALAPGKEGDAGPALKALIQPHVSASVEDLFVAFRQETGHVDLDRIRSLKVRASRMPPPPVLPPVIARLGG